MLPVQYIASGGAGANMDPGHQKLLYRLQTNVVFSCASIMHVYIISALWLLTAQATDFNEERCTLISACLIKKCYVAEY